MFCNGYFLLKQIRIVGEKCKGWDEDCMCGSWMEGGGVGHKESGELGWVPWLRKKKKMK